MYMCMYRCVCTNTNVHVCRDPPPFMFIHTRYCVLYTCVRHVSAHIPTVAYTTCSITRADNGSKALRTQPGIFCAEEPGALHLRRATGHCWVLFGHNSSLNRKDYKTSKWFMVHTPYEGYYRIWYMAQILFFIWSSRNWLFGGRQAQRVLLNGRTRSLPGELFPCAGQAKVASHAM